MSVDIKAITEDQTKFYKALFSKYDNYIDIRLINNGKSKQIFLTYDELLNYPTPQDTHVYVGIYERRYKTDGKTPNCTVTDNIYLDFDNTTLEAINHTIDNKGIPLPSMIVSSGNGYHVYWKLDKPAGHKLKPIIDELQELLNADPAATDTARILRIPDTMNVKYNPPIQSKLIEVNNNVTSLDEFESILGVKAMFKHPTSTGSIKELESIKYNGLNNMASGVIKGERNFCTGRIVQTLKKLDLTKQETIDIVFRWNTLNEPKVDTKVLKQEIRTFWNDEDNKYYGQTFSNERLQELNNRFIDDETIFFSNSDDPYSYDNELLKPKVFQKTKGLTFAVLSIIKLAEDEGISRAHIADLSKRNLRDKTLMESLLLLEKLEYIKIFKKGRSNYYRYTRKSNYKRGYTKTDDILQKMYVYGGLTDPEYKLMILIEKYAYNNKRQITTGTEILAYGMGLTERTIVRNLSQLEYKQFIKREMKHGKRFIRIIYR